MSRFKIVIEKNTSSVTKNKVINTSNRQKGTSQKHVAIASGIIKYDKALIVKKINLMSDYLSTEQSVTISKEKVKQILESK
jgi:hypothetical protein